MLSWFGGIAVDLSEATLARDARLTVTTIFGGIALRVPDGWRVESRLRPSHGGVAIDVGEAGADAPLLVLEGIALFGGVAVRSVSHEDR